MTWMFTKATVFGLVSAALAGWLALRFLVGRYFPPQVPSDLAFSFEREHQGTLYQVAEALVEEFRPHNGDGVWCLGRVRGNAARVLFHAGPQNRRGNLWRNDYLLVVSREGKRTRVTLALNSGYTYLWPRRREIEALRARLVEAYGRPEAPSLTPRS